MSTGSDPVQGARAHTSCNYVENLKVSVLQPSVLRLEDATELQFPCTSRHDYVKILKLVLKNRSVPKMAWSLEKSVQHIDLPIIKFPRPEGSRRIKRKAAGTCKVKKNVPVNGGRNTFGGESSA